MNKTQTKAFLDACNKDPKRGGGLWTKPATDGEHTYACNGFTFFAVKAEEIDCECEKVTDKHNDIITRMLKVQGNNLPKNISTDHMGMKVSLPEIPKDGNKLLCVNINDAVAVEYKHIKAFKKFSNCKDDTVELFYSEKQNPVYLKYNEYLGVVMPTYIKALKDCDFTISW